MQIKPVLLSLTCLAGPVLAQDQAQSQPLSAIDWLAVQRNAPPVVVLPDQNPVAQSAAVPDVDVQPLDAPGLGGVGLLSSAVTGLPPSLWQGSSEADLIAALERLQTRRPAIPALTQLLHILMLAEADPPASAKGDALLRARATLLYQHGLVPQAEALMEQMGTMTPALFDLAFDLALLTGSDEALCGVLNDTPSLSTDLPTRIWCATRSGDFPHAMTIYQTGVALNQMSTLDAELLLRFLDPEYSETVAPLQPPVRPTPLQFRLFEAIGEALPTTPLPLPFAVVELSGDSGWRAQLQAAERLARVGAIDGNQLLGVYTAQDPAASGGIWDRVEALQRFEAALAKVEPDAISTTLEQVWPQMRAAGLLVSFANLFAPQLQGLALSDRAQTIARTAGLLTDAYEDVARDLTNSPDAGLRFLAALAQGQTPASIPVDMPHAAALAAAWDGAPQAPSGLAGLPTQNRLGEALLTVLQSFESGAAGNDADLTDALRALRAFGLEDTARRAALQLAILDKEGARR
ncbi:MAG: hypothetical protein MRY75_18980 [Marivita sp.]|uniref:hypothetical protein n=1 Tax=Marivita sp. TaxID=2003365 RepID=UPI0025C29F84|nr:hypothetical protein [Marivita sp.]MCI5112634.1 hypothetical protein [Marivita sp.]